MAFARAGLDDAGHWAANGPRLGHDRYSDSLSVCVWFVGKIRLHGLPIWNMT